jgi:hypothetical protein
MNGVNIVTNAQGVKTGFLIDIKALHQHSLSGKDVVQHLLSTEDLEDMIDVELAQYDAAESWNTAQP